MPLHQCEPGQYFNSRTRVGCDRQGRKLCGADRISTHAPAWGATFYHNARLCSKRFQLTHPRGVRPYLPKRSCVILQFQLTHPRGVRQIFLVQNNISLYFNSRTRVGCDGSARASSCLFENFNSRTRVGCDVKRR